MRLKELTYAKKVGLPDYGSLGLTLTAELESTDDVKAVYEELKKVVEENINGLLTANEQERPNPEERPNESGEDLATLKQISWIKRLTEQKEVETPDFSELTKKEASRLIDELKES